MAYNSSWRALCGLQNQIYQVSCLVHLKSSPYNWVLCKRGGKPDVPSLQMGRMSLRGEIALILRCHPKKLLSDVEVVLILCCCSSLKCWSSFSFPVQISNWQSELWVLTGPAFCWRGFNLFRTSGLSDESSFRRLFGLALFAPLWSHLPWVGCRRGKLVEGIRWGHDPWLLFLFSFVWAAISFYF